MAETWISQAEFEPTETAVITCDNGERALVVRDACGRFTGVGIPSIFEPYIDVLERLVQKRSSFLANAWREYAKTARCGPFLFHDVLQLTRAHVLAPELVSEFDPLDRFGSATEVFHNANQAVLMGVAHRRGVGRVRLVDAVQQSTKHDFTIETESGAIPVELKTVMGLAMVVARRDGLSLSEKYVRTLTANIARDVSKGRRQASGSGIVFLYVWCSQTGVFVTDACADWRIDQSEVFKPGGTVLVSPDAMGRGQAHRLPMLPDAELMEALESRLLKVKLRGLSSDLSGGLVCVFRGLTEATVGGVVGIDNQMESPT